MTGKQERFIQEYLVDHNGAAAARRAGYNPANAASIASRLLAQPEIRAACEQAAQEQAQRLGIRSDQVVEELKTIAFAEGSDASGAQVKLASKLRALELLGKHLGLFDGGGRGQTETVKIIEDV